MTWPKDRFIASKAYKARDLAVVIHDCGRAGTRSLRTSERVPANGPYRQRSGLTNPPRCGASARALFFTSCTASAGVRPCPVAVRAPAGLPSFKNTGHVTETSTSADAVPTPTLPRMPTARAPVSPTMRAARPSTVVLASTATMDRSPLTNHFSPVMLPPIAINHLSR